MRPLCLIALLCACSATVAPVAPVAPSAPSAVDAPPSDCPAAPRVELWETRNARPAVAFRAGGHITALDVSLDEDPYRALVGTLDVKGEQALEAHARALALANATPHDGAPARAMVLTLDGRVLASLEVTVALRGRRFRIPLRPDGAFTDDTRDALREAVRHDRRCFAGRSIDEPAPTP